MRRISILLAAVLALIFDNTRAQSLPYNPTTIFLSPIDPDLAYIFLPSTSPSNQSQLASLNISTTIQSSNLSLETLTSDLPFLDGQNKGEQAAYIPSISSSGSLGVYAGQCTKSSSFWIFTPSNDSAIQSVGAGTWREMSTTPSLSVSASALPDANFLASSFSFSTLVNSNDTQRTVYAFGGMCPTDTTSNSTTWQSAAQYSNSMLKLSYSTPTSYDLSLSINTGNTPIAEAGFTFTALTPTFSNSSAGIMTQAQNFVLLGGHTSTAFINMSQVALFSLPQESWSFQSIDSAPSTGSTELAVKSTSTSMVTPDSRSGHTAVLSADGSSLIVFGGWVGDIGQAAQPQLAILQTGSGFGGTGDWTWDFPSTTGIGLSAGEGIYGHGAVMLPGNVMMVIGGFSIPAPSSSRLSKKSTAAPGALFLNTTSMTWISNYINPSHSSPTSASAGGSSTSGSTSNAKVGLGAGLGLGLAAIIGALCVYFWYSRRLKRRRNEAREKDLQDLSRSAADYYAAHGAHASMSQQQRWSAYQNGEMAQREGLMPLSSSTSNLGNRGMGITPEGGYGPMAYTPSGAYGELLRTNSNRSGASIPRKPVNSRNARGYYQPTPGSSSSQSYSGFDFGTGHSRANSLGTAGLIHPIYEADEDLDGPDAQNPPQDDNGDTDVGRAISGSEIDPFVDPQPSIHVQPPRSNPGSRPGTSYGDRGPPTPESSARDREREIKNWVADWAAADALMHSRAQSMTHSGRISPSKESASGRTGSSLSERSVANTVGLSRNGSTRNNSLTAFLSGGPSSWNPFVTFGTTPAGLGSITEQRNGDVSPVSDHASIHGHIRGGSNPPPSSCSATSSSFTTAHTSQSLSGLRAEGESLLPRPHEDISPGSPSKRKAAAFSLHRHQGSWLGSLKRVFIGTDDGNGSMGSGSARSSPTRGYRSPSFSNSPTRADYGITLGGAGPAPRRAVSATATMWRRKQGRDDWQDSAEPAEQQRRANTLTLDGSGSWRSRLRDHAGGGEVRPGEDDDEEEEWDIERAVERRVVQVMFTVPKEKLRVVNQDVAADESSETGSLKESEKILEPPSGTEIIEAPVVVVEEEQRERLVGSEKEGSGWRTGSPASSKGKGRVQEIVEKLEGWKD